jgi:glycosyltransferase involved in cell wall biosynthesis
MKAKRSILFFHAGAELYGADKILHILAKGLVERNWSVMVVLPWNGELKQTLETAGVNVIVLNHGVLRRKYFSLCGLLDRMRRIVKAGVTLNRIVRANGVTVVHTNTSVVFAGAFTSWLAEIPHIWHVHEITTRPKAVWRILSWLIPRLSERVVCVSHAVLAHLVAGNEANGVKGQVLYNGIERLMATAKATQSVRKELGVTDEEVLVGMVGRVNDWKGQMTLVAAAETVLDRCPHVKFVFVGGTFAGEEHLMFVLRERVRSEILAEKVTILGFRKDIPAIMSALDIFVLPSTQPDPLPTVVLEAMSVGCPVVGFAHGGICEMVVNNETGLLVAPCSIPALANAIEDLVVNPVRRHQYGAAGLQRFNESFSVQIFLNGFEHIYEGVIDR